MWAELLLGLTLVCAAADAKYWNSTTTCAFPSMVLSTFHQAPRSIPGGNAMELLVDVIVAPSSFVLKKQPRVTAAVSSDGLLSLKTDYTGFAVLPLELNEILHRVEVQVDVAGGGGAWHTALRPQVESICLQTNITDGACARLFSEVVTIQDWVRSDTAHHADCTALSFPRLDQNRIRVCVNLTEIAPMSNSSTVNHCRPIDALQQSFRLQHVVPGRTYVAQTYVASIGAVSGYKESDPATLSFTHAPLAMTSPRHGANVLSTRVEIHWTRPTPRNDQLCVFVNETASTCVDGDAASVILENLNPGTTTLQLISSMQSSPRISVHVMDAASALSLAFVTACDEVYMQNGRLANLVGSIHYWEPSTTIEIYDLGLSAASRAEIQTWRRTTLLQLPFDQLPHHFRDLRRTYAFKPWGLVQALGRTRHVLWIDANMELRRPVDDIRAILAQHGVFYTVQRQRFPNTRFHAAATIRRFNCTVPLYSRPQVPAGLQAYTRGSWAYDHVLQPLVACAMDDTCIAPPGTNRSNHRQDQTVLNAILCGLDVNTSLVHEDVKFWLSSHVDDLSEPLQPTPDPTHTNDVVIYTRRDHPWKPYTSYIDRVTG
ncbi:Aste57867_18282 [Aphanomyces stellatus]|uniref:Aste57867_18282 protein n=1 Tax=Aphanomyces stellatus TaxID=120398 RepID=A0A485LBE4_9STRA|nr:hypothetical protein As57867_018220 [Aphanomyces stellatus]VFT95019.1 Aste57867_18282 [Aphanomyces stellatus]